LDVVVPFVKELSGSIKSQSLPTSVHRAFQRVISAIKTVALVYQHQRKKDEEGRVIAEMSDYSIVYQLMQDPFRESIGQLKKYTDKRIQVIESEGIISPRRLAERAGVSVAAISQWMKSWIEKGVLMWCDQFGGKFPDTESLEKAKRSGNSYIRIKNSFGLPSPYGLTRDSRWRPGGELDCTYDLGLDDGTDEDEDLDVRGECPEEEKAFSFSDFHRMNGVQSDGVKVLSGNGGMQNEKMATKVTFVTGDAGEIENELTKEFDEVLAQ